MNYGFGRQFNLPRKNLHVKVRADFQRKIFFNHCLRKNPDIIKLRIVSIFSRHKFHDITKFVYQVKVTEKVKNKISAITFEWNDLETCDLAQKVPFRNPHHMYISDFHGKAPPGEYLTF